MDRYIKQVALLRFQGPRFEDHGLDVEVLPDIVAYTSLLQDTAKELWRKKNPERRRLPKNFDAGITLKFFELTNGSTGVPLVRSTAAGHKGALPLLLEDELDEAATLLEQVILAAGRGQAAPKQFPRAVVPLFEQFGHTLRAGESILIFAESAEVGARYDKRVKERILGWETGTYSDSIDLLGEVRATDLDGRKFTLRLPDGRKVIGRFEQSQESTVLEALGEHSSRQLHLIGIGEFAFEDGALQQIGSVERLELAPPRQPAEKVIPIWERISALGAALPDAAWQDTPSDLAENVEKYLYGPSDRR